MAIDWGAELDDLKAIAHGASTLFYAAIVVAIVAVVLSAQSNSVTILQQIFAFLQWLVGQIVAPVSGGQNVALTATLVPAGQLSGSGGSLLGNGSSASANSGFSISQPFNGVSAFDSGGDATFSGDDGIATELVSP